MLLQPLTRSLLPTVLLLIIFLTGFSAEAIGQQDTIKQDSIEAPGLNVYLDCWFCDRDHIKREISYVNYVRDRKDADVHIMMMRESAANRGKRYTAHLIGQKGYDHLMDTLRFNVGPKASQEERRQKVLQALKAGLTPYLLKTSLWKNLEVDYLQAAEEEEVKDKWNYWIFEVGMNGRMNGEESTSSYDIGGEIEANKVTREIKLEIEGDADYEKSIYEVNSSTITSIHRTYELNGLLVKSLSQHWSAGGFAGLYSSRYRNINISYNLSPAVEFNIYPYLEATTRQLTVLYRPQYRYNAYQDTTIFGKTDENLLSQSLSVDYEVRKEWGSIDFSLNLSHYFHDFSKNRISLRSSVSLNLLKGLNLNFHGGASLIHDQLSLPKGEATTEEVLTRQKQLATNYEYYTRLGISYTFGSMYNNIVNPRF